MEILSYVAIAVMTILYLSGAPLALAFAFGSSIIALFVMKIPLQNLSHIFFSSIHSYPLLACPFFILAGNLITRSGGLESIRDFMKAMFGHWPGGLAVATIIFSTFLGAISGSSAACVAILATVVIPILIGTGYDRPFASGLIVVAGELGLIIPPSLFFILFGALNRISIPDLFLAGIGPGVLSAFFMCVVAIVISKKRKYTIISPASWKERRQTFLKAFPVLVMPLVVLGGIYGGIFSPTQSAAVAVFYSIGMGFFVYRVMKPKDILDALIETVRIASMIYFLIIGSDILGRMFAFIMLPQKITDLVIAMELGPLSFLLVVEAVLLSMGFFFSGIPMVIVAIPLFLPSVYSLGIDPVLYGALAILNSLIGEITPPFGPQLWIAAPLCKEKMGPIIREAWPFLGAMTLAMVVTTFFPGIAMFLVNLFR